jgi:hypothetical protein
MKSYNYYISYLTFFLSCFILVSCSSSDLDTRQYNDPRPQYNLFHMFDNYPSLKEATDHLNADEATPKLADFMLNGSELDVFTINAGKIMSDPSISFVGEISKLLGIIINDDTCYYNNPSDGGFYANRNTLHGKNFYQAVDTILDNTDLSYDILQIGAQVLKQLSEKDPLDVEDTIEDVVDDIKDAGFKNDFIDLSKDLSKLLITTDYPIWLDSDGAVVASRKNINPNIHTNTDLGNMVRGVNMIVAGLNEISANDPAVREIIYDIIRKDLRSLAKSDSIKQVIKDTIINLEKYCAYDGEAYNTSDYHSDSNGIYVNNELKETIREMFPTIVKLFIRNDDDGSTTPDYSIASDPKGRSPIEVVTCALDKLKQEGIDYSKIDLEPSLRRTIEYNAYGKKITEPGAYKVSYLDHFLYATSTAAKFGYLTRKSSDGEPSSNSNRGHGIPTNGVLTINDIIYSIDMTTGDLGWVSSICPGMNLYSMALDLRVEQAENISRSADIFDDTNMSQHKFYMGSDYPISCQVPPSCAGDAGLPNGGRSAVTPTSDTTTMSTKESVSQNDNRTYYPKVADGLGATNTTEFLLSLIPRACWDGAGPFYYAPGDAKTISFNWPGKGTRNVKVYYKPNGEIYAYVYQPSSSASTWEYYYPVSGNDLVDSTGQRSNRYQDKMESDYYMIKYKSSGTTYYAVSPVNPDGASHVKSGKPYVLKGQTSGNATRFILEEKIRQNDPIRPCKSQEEAIYRNYQWLAFDKKMTFVIPLYINMMGIEIGGFFFAEGNGFLGLVNSSKGAKNGYWLSNNPNYPFAKYANSGIGVGNIPSSNNPDYMESDIPGDGRLTLLLTDNPLGFTADVMFAGLIGKGYAFPGAIAESIVTVLRLGFLQEELIEADSAEIANPSSETWNNRNKLLPIIVALTGALRDVTVYETAATGNNYNYQGKHKFPIAQLIEGILIPLSKPHMRYLEDTEHSPGDPAYWGKRWMQRVGNESEGMFSFFKPNIPFETDKAYFTPNENLRGLLSLMTGKQPGTLNGLVPLLADNTKLVSHAIALLQNLGSSDKEAARVKLFKGLEQFLTAIKSSKSEAMVRGYTTQDNTKHSWLFQPREDDILLNDFLTYDGPVFPSDPDWEDYDSAVDFIQVLLGGENDITDNLVNVMDAVLKIQLTEPEIESLLYTMGKLFARNSNGTWQYHGESPDYDQVYRMMTFIPAIHELMKGDGSGGNYMNLLDNLHLLIENDASFLYYFTDCLYTHYSSEQILKDLYDFTSSDLVNGENAVLWRDLSSMMTDLSAIAGSPLDHDKIVLIYEQYGFQR